MLRLGMASAGQLPALRAVRLIMRASLAHRPCSGRALPIIQQDVSDGLFGDGAVLPLHGLSEPWLPQGVLCLATQPDVIAVSANRWVLPGDLDLYDIHPSMRRQIAHYLAGVYPHVD